MIDDMAESVIVRHLEDGTSRVSVATEDVIQEWLVLVDGTMLLTGSVFLGVQVPS